MRRASVGEVAPQTWTKLSASGNEFVYTNGPLSCAFRCRDTVTGHEHDFVLDRGARFTMPPGGKFDLVECFHWDPVACSVEIALGAGRIEYPTGSRIPNGPDLRGNYAHHLQAGGAGTYAVQAFLNPSDSGIIAEISMFRGIYAGALGVTWFFGETDPSADGVTGAGFTVQKPWMADLAANIGGSPSGLDYWIHLGATVPVTANSSGRIFYQILGTAEKYYELDSSRSPVILRPGYYIGCVEITAIQPVTFSANTPLMSGIEWVERKA